MLPDRAKFYDSLKNYNSLQHANKNPMYGLEYDEHSYYKREGEPGNYRYYWTKQEYEAHLAELEKQRNKNMQAGQNYEADRWKKNDQNKMKNQQIKNNSQANAEADRWKRNDQNKLKEQQIKNNLQANAEADRWKRDQENKEKEKQRQENIRKNAEASLHDGDRYERYKKEKEIREKNQGNNPEADRYARLAEQQKREKQIKDAQERVKQREQEKIAKKNEGNNPEAERYKKQQLNQKWEQQQKEAQQRVAEREREAKERENETNTKIEEAQEKWDKAIDATYKQNESNNKTRETEIAQKKENSKSVYDNHKGDSEFGSKFSEVAQDLGINISVTQNGDVIYSDPDTQHKINQYADEANAKFQEYITAKEEAKSIKDPEERLKKLTYANDRYNEYMSIDNLRQSTVYKMQEDAYDKFDEVIKKMEENNNESLIDKVKKKAKSFFS